MRKEYLEMLENVGRVKTTVTKSAQEEAAEKEFKKLIGETEPSVGEELDSAMEDTKSAETTVKKDKKDAVSNDQNL